MEWGLNCGRLFGIRIKLHWAFVLFILFAMVRAQDKQFEAVYLIVLFVSVLLHELGHCLAARHFGQNPDKILLWPLGGLAYVGGAKDAREDFWVAFFGPFVQLVIGGVVGAVLYFQGASFHFNLDILRPLAVEMPLEQITGTFRDWLLPLIFGVQVWLFAFNVFLPAYPLDGGRMLVAATLGRLGAMKASGMAMILSLVCGVYLMARRDMENGSICALFLLCEAAMLYQYRITGMIFQHPAFSHSSRPLYSSKARKTAAKPSRSKQVPHLRLVDSKQCPQCGRSLPTTAKMCGFCEISV